MKIVKVGWMNDERQDLVVRIMDTRYDHWNATGDIFVTLSPCEYREFEVHIPDNAFLYVKKWPKMVMLSYSEQTSPQQSDQQQDQPDGEQSS